MQNTSRATRIRRFGSIAAAVVLTSFAVAAVAQGLNGRSTVRSALQQEGVVGQPHMTPTAIADIPLCQACVRRSARRFYCV